MIMIITCPQCTTKFRLDDERLPQGEAKVRCSRCQHIFRVHKPTPIEESPLAIEVSKPEWTEPSKRKTPSRQSPSWLKWSLLFILLVLIGVGIAWQLGTLPWLDHVLDRKKVSSSLETTTQYLGEKADQFKKLFPSLAFVKQYLGIHDEKEGTITLEKIRGYYLETIKQGRIYVIEGDAVNHWNEFRSFIRVKGILRNAKGATVEEKVVYCGNILSEKDLKELTKEAIDKSLSSQFGISFSNVNIPPQKSVPFMVVFLNLPPVEGTGKPSEEPVQKPQDVSPSPAEFTLEVVSSQKGSKS
jgi:predicted Zn finger-like uncharacterized protein